MAQETLTQALVGFVFLAVLILIAVNYCSFSFSCGRGGIHEGIDAMAGRAIGPDGQSLPTYGELLAQKYKQKCREYRQALLSYAYGYMQEPGGGTVLRRYEGELADIEAEARRDGINLPPCRNRKK